ncbi:GntR family transcriptional regulator [Paenibacillus sp. J31TS4]|uniref:GntR family transcriptional regulator n=1 Tax=Paenibacillus sp. J31TS4 TaxID=2807195 RepID=UPI0020BF5C78|nr:GntR family transcriptional regulator [Paenibacillus sp. J31TS4]
MMEIFYDPIHTVSIQYFGIQPPHSPMEISPGSVGQAVLPVHIHLTEDAKSFFVIVNIEQFCYTKYRTKQDGGDDGMVILDPESNIPLYMQLRTQIIEAIVRGDLALGDTLPSVRGLAGDLGINMHTVNKSYHELEAKGIIEIVPKKGAVIIANTEKGPSNKQREDITEELRPAVAEALVHGMKEADLHQLISELILKMKGT